MLATCMITALVAAAPAPSAFRVSNALGDGMVLQRGKPVSLWGAGATAGAVTVAVGGKTFSGTADATGSWAVDGVGPFDAGDHGVITITDSSKAVVTLSDVLFGDVFLCSGQSNMVFSANQSFTAAEDIAAANNPKYQSIRLFTAQPLFATAPATDFPGVEQKWTRANSTAVGNPKPFSYFSSVCWVTGKALFDSLNGTVPIGLLCSAFGGTRVHNWSGPDALAKCNQTAAAPRTETRSWNHTAAVSEQANGDSGLWYGMITPVLKMQFKAAFWIQGESDVNPSDSVMEPQRGGEYYGCAIKAMVADWRVKFQQTLPFMYVQLSPWVGHEAATSFYQLPAIRQAQLTVNSLENTGFASAVDLGDPNPSTNVWGGVHWRNKQPAALRLAAVARHLLYGSTEQTKGPEATSATKTGSKIAIAFDPSTVGPSGLQLKPMVCPFFALNQPTNIARCGWLETRPAGGNWTNTTFSIGSDGNTLSVNAASDVAEVRYLYADWPVATVYNADGFPATPFVLPVTSKTASV